MKKNRITKEPEERRQEILDTALSLFREQGFAETSVSQIVRKVGVAQGTFYYHFTSKKEVLYHLLYRGYINELVEAAKTIAEEDNLPALEKFRRLAGKEVEISISRLPAIQKIQNADLFRRIFTRTVRDYVPFIARIIEQGIAEGVFKTLYPVQYCAFFHVSKSFFFHPGILQWSEDALGVNIRAMTSLMEAAFGAAPGSFDFYNELIPLMHHKLKEENP